MGEHYCDGCFKFDKEAGKCIAFKELFPMWEDNKHAECWGREEDPRGWLKTLEEIEQYYTADSGDEVGLSATQRRWLAYSKPKEEELKKQIEAIESKEIKELMLEDQRRGKGGGGEKNKDGSMFGPQTMKDNRFAHRRNNPKTYNGWHS